MENTIKVAKYNEIELDKPFFGINGELYGIITEKKNGYDLTTYRDPDLTDRYSIVDITEEYEEDEPLELEIYYLIDEDDEEDDEDDEDSLEENESDADEDDEEDDEEDDDDSSELIEGEDGDEEEDEDEEVDETVGFDEDEDN